MRIELLSIGDELLKGMTLNTNLLFLSSQLQQSGYLVSRQTVVGDDLSELTASFHEVFERADLAIATGGLGPTLDDHTRAAAAEYFGCGWRFDKSVAAEIEGRFGKEHPSLQDQAKVPEIAQVLLNTIGTAPGLVLEKSGKILILLPGVQQEMQTLLTEQVLPLILRRFPTEKSIHRVQVHLSLISENWIDPHLRSLHARYPDVSMGIYPGTGTVSVLLQSDKIGQLHACEEELCHMFKIYRYCAPNGKISEAVHQWFIENRKKLALAESCTGGAIATSLTAIPSASEYFLGSFVTYSNLMKQAILGVPEEILNCQGAVSADCVRAMLEGVFTHSEADYAIAVSGIAGPTGGTEEKPIGTVWAAIGQRGKEPDVGCFRANGSRPTIISTTTNYLLALLYRKVALGIPAFPFFPS